MGQWTNIEPHLLLYVFLPPLIFGEAMSLNYYNAKGALSQALIMAGPGVVIGATLLGAIAKYMLHYNWSWNLAMIFGSIMACTDPVAVVALLKSAGASPKLTIIIVGESLLNDGTAMVMFNIFNNCFNGQTYTIAQIVSYFFSACLGAAVFGAVMGYCAIRWLRRTNRPLSQVDVLVQIAITLCCAYTTFFVAENTLGISGVLACVGAGAVICWLGPPIILNHETMHHVWGMIEWSLNTMLFMHAGLIIGNRVFDAVIPIDWFYLFAFYVIMMAVRCFVLLVLYPFISRYGHKCTVNEAIFMSWGGLRGVRFFLFCSILMKFVCSTSFAVVVFVPNFIFLTHIAFIPCTVAGHDSCSDRVRGRACRHGQRDLAVVLLRWWLRRADPGDQCPARADAASLLGPAGQGYDREEPNHGADHQEAAQTDEQSAGRFSHRVSFY